MPEYRFDEIAINSKKKKKPIEEDKYTYIGLEHLDTGSLTVNRWGSEIAPTGEKLVMHKGDVLFGKRRAYQKKVAIAPFDGIRFIDKNKGFDNAIIRHADIIWIQPNALSHSQYYTIIDAVRQLKKTVCYFTYASAVKCARQLCLADQEKGI